MTFPADYPVDNLKGKDATFDVTVKAVKTAGETKIDDEFAKSLGLERLDQLKGLLKGQIEQELNGLTRTHMKRQLLDQLADAPRFPGPANRWSRPSSSRSCNSSSTKRATKPIPQAALAEMEKERGDYRRIAERRVRLGLLLSEIGPPTASRSASRK